MDSAGLSQTLPTALKPPDPPTANADGGAAEPRTFTMAAAKPRLTLRFRPVEIPTRQYSTVEGKPSIHFTTMEFDAGVALFQHSLIAKFTMGRPSIEEICRVFKKNWPMRGRATVNDIWDSRHLMIILDSEDDAKVALTSQLRKVGHAMFRLFRYTPDYNPFMEFTTTTKWVRLTGLHPGFVTTNFVAGMVNTFGDFLDLDERSKACSTLKYARACVEIDVTKSIPEEVRITLSDGRVFWQKIEVEGNLSFCSHYKIHGHILADYRKKKSQKPVAQVNQAGRKNKKVSDNRPIEVTISGGHGIKGNKSTSHNSKKEWIEEALDKDPIDPTAAVVLYKAQQSPILSQERGNITSSNRRTGEVTFLNRNDTHLDMKEGPYSNNTGGSLVYCEELNNLVAPSAVEHFKKVRKGVQNDTVSKALDRIALEGEANMASSSKVPTEKDILCSFVYGALDSNIRKELWEDLNNVAASCAKPWFICGDFNALLSWKEKKGGNNKKGRSIREFNEFIASAGVNDAGFKGNSYTWSNNQEGENQIWERLDRCLVNGLAMASYPNLEVQHLARRCSDHCPLLLNLKGAGSRRKGTFRFLGVWTDHDNVQDIIKDTWVDKAHKNLLLNFALKLKNLRTVLRKWNWEIFGDINLKVRQLTQRVVEMENDIQLGRNDTSRDAVSKVKEELFCFLRYQSAILEAKSKHKWIMEGDRNSAFFHASIKARRIRNNMKLLMEDDSYSEDAKTIGAHAVNYFQRLFGGFSSNVAEMEIKAAVSSMDPTSSPSPPSPDGFTGKFYGACWDIKKVHLVEAVQGFFKGL
ncbi:hypothetical protein QQ045_012619 [Rhodiola kirilowii]